MGAAKIRWVKASYGRYPWDSAKERGHKSYAFVRYVGAIHESPLHWRYAS
jgi:hypothetical protein